jgi:hypothetical protein
MSWFGQLLGIEFKFGVEVSGECVVGGELLGHGVRGGRGQPFGLIDRGELGEFGVTLAADRHILTQRHGHRAGDETG